MFIMMKKSEFTEDHILVEIRRVRQNYDKLEACEYVCNPETQIAVIFACVVFGAIALNFLLGFVDDLFNSYKVFKAVRDLRVLLNWVYWGSVVVVNPLLFHVKKVAKAEEAGVTEAAE